MRGLHRPTQDRTPLPHSAVTPSGKKAGVSGLLFHRVDTTSGGVDTVVPGFLLLVSLLSTQNQESGLRSQVSQVGGGS